MHRTAGAHGIQWYRTFYKWHLTEAIWIGESHISLGVCKTFLKPILHPKESPKSRISQKVSVNLSTDDYFGPYWNLKIYPLYNIYIRKDNDFTIHLILFTLCVFFCGLVLVDFAVVIPGDLTGNGTIKRMATKDRDLCGSSIHKNWYHKHNRTNHKKTMHICHGLYSICNVGTWQCIHNDSPSMWYSQKAKPWSEWQADQ